MLFFTVIIYSVIFFVNSPRQQRARNVKCKFYNSGAAIQIWIRI